LFGKLAHRHARLSASLSVLAALLLLTPTVSAQPADVETPLPSESVATEQPTATPSPPKPWQVGVEPEAREEALVLFREANDLFGQSEYRQAEIRYRRALSRWDHPRIHGNLATTLIYLGEPLGAMAHLERALVFAGAPFEDHVYQQLRTNKKLLQGQLARVDVQCDIPGVSVTMDGEELFVAPGTKSILTTAGKHQVVGRKTGHRTFTRDFLALGGESSSIPVTVVPLSEVTKAVRRWRAWQPWTVLGTGVVVAAIGLPFRQVSLSSRDQYEDAVARLCPQSCETASLPPEVRDLKERSRRWNRVEIGFYVIGTAVAATGAVLAILNRERHVVVEEPMLYAVPVVSSDHLGFSAAWSF
jgi:hypothetical protein